ncbi:hypothetical protein MPSEU_000926800 [Mayamaea pseudoterrestris]|nr:hypothetical protein MPSEU_000926800 [Mayamaea pseudoterrestris]
MGCSIACIPSFHCRTTSSNKSTFLLLAFSTLLPLLNAMVTSLEVSHINSHNVYQYNICNGLSNQLLYHSASIAIAIEQRKAIVEVPDYFIVHGVQYTEDYVLPSASNSVPFEVAFDAIYFQQEIQAMGIKAVFKSFDFSKRQIPCAGLQSLHQADAMLLLKVLNTFRPSPKLSKYITTITNALPALPSQGICVHHRNDEDWFAHCNRWSSIRDGIYRGNCLGVPGHSFLQSLESRGVTSEDSQFVYYCGDHSDHVPRELRTSPYSIYTRFDFMSDIDRMAIEELVPNAQNMRDIWALIDFSICSGLKSFVGNSVSTFSAIQIAIRHSNNAYWYNSQSIPLGDIWRVYQIPIVYTYTELSQSSGKHLLQASIASIRRVMPDNTIHILYHGSSDTVFRNWLKERKVIIHQHDPTWRDQIEAMRLNGDVKTSHLFLHAGNYFGTWQRIDIPLFVESEYCLLLDADTIVTRPFTLKDFGLDMTLGIAMSAELKPDNRPSNAGVTLMNVPRMRETYKDFLEFILRHVGTAKFDHPSPSDQGAYLEFYEHEVQFLSKVFNFKPYWQTKDIDYQQPYIIHFHGAKPHDYLKHIMGTTCPVAIRGLCKNGIKWPSLCHSLQSFARSSKEVDQVSYCTASFDDAGEALFCNDILDALVSIKEECTDVASVVRTVLNREPEGLGLNRALILRNLQRPLPLWFWLAAAILSTVILVYLRKNQRQKMKGRYNR